MPARQQDRFDGLPRRALADELTVIEATTGRSRRLGLSRLEVLDPGWGLHIPRCPAVHTFGMRFALDLVWLTNDGSVARVDRDVRPRRIRMCRRARSVVETNAGRAERFLAAGLGA